ncbi:hypothetical protein ACJIZ3_007294 [Penstemon smallii]|uniref:Receptor-like serine/threonine-protein kinase n=1 Tax=Penstemon smallii TaxID=265156 RepID=A0ABD3SA46_9LAMI
MFLLSCSAYVSSQPIYPPTANLATSWINNDAIYGSLTYEDNTTVRPILVKGRETLGFSYACGFYCNGNCETYLFAVFIVLTYRNSAIYNPFPRVVWSANRDNPVRIGATLELTPEGDLVLRDVDGTLAWSTGTSGMSVASLNLTKMGNLVLFDKKNSTVWQSFDHPTDALVPGQILASGQNLTASASPTNWTRGGLFSLSMTSKGLVASIQADSPQVYYSNLYTNVSQESNYARYENGSLRLYVTGTSNAYASITFPQATSGQYIKLGYDGHLRVLEWRNRSWTEVSDIFSSDLAESNYPMVCGKYGIYTNGQCSCPSSGASAPNFKQINERHPNLGCLEVIPLTCDDSPKHSFLDIEDATYFRFMVDIKRTSLKGCKEACLKNCSCKAIIFQYDIPTLTKKEYPMIGDCYLPSEIFSFMNTDKTDANSFFEGSSVSIKVQIDSNVTSSSGEISPIKVEREKRILRLVLGSTTGILCVAVAIGLTVFAFRKKKKAKEAEEDYLDHVPGMLTRFSYEELVTATDNFDKKLGEGGFGSVYEGSLKDNTRIAVKCLDGIGHIKKSFLAEVETLGNIHHVNLVRLVGFCADRSHRLLVYEYMCYASLDRWIYNRSQESALDWNCRRKIILDIAKGLAYLHEECRQKIIHLDIKPQNILLDENYNAKIADFGLSKLIDRDQSQVVTAMRGTPGYLAPEWLNAVITEKVDVYSFGVVVLEILCGRKIFDISLPEEDKHLLGLFEKKGEDGQLLDLIDKCCKDMQSNGREVLEMMQIAAWCLQSNYVSRPSMSMLIKVMEGVKEFAKDLDYNFLHPQYFVNQIQVVEDVTLLSPSFLSGPR